MTQPTATVPCTLFVSVQRMHLNHTAEKKYIVAAIIKHLFSALKKWPGGGRVFGNLSLLYLNHARDMQPVMFKYVLSFSYLSLPVNGSCHFSIPLITFWIFILCQNNPMQLSLRKRSGGSTDYQGKPSLCWKPTQPKAYCFALCSFLWHTGHPQLKCSLSFWLCV